MWFDCRLAFGVIYEKAHKSPQDLSTAVYVGMAHGTIDRVADETEKTAG